VTTHSAGEAERIGRASAGCLPRDESDRAYAEAAKWPAAGSNKSWIIKEGPGK